MGGMSGTYVNKVRRAAFALLLHHDRSGERRSVEYGGWTFSAPVALFAAEVPTTSGLFAIQVRNWSWAPRGFEPIHFGQSDNLYKHVLGNGDDGFVSWLMHRRSIGGLFVSLMPTPWMRQSERELAENHLLRQYQLVHTRSVQEFLRGFHEMSASTQ